MINAAISVDKLKICLNQPMQAYEYLVANALEDASTGKRSVVGDGYRLLFVEEADDGISAVLTVFDVDGDVKLGTFVFNNSKKYNEKCFFTFDNAALYRHYVRLGDGYRHNMIDCLIPIIRDLGLTFNNVTECEIAFDSSVNYVRKLRRLIKDTENYDMFLNGKKVVDVAAVLDGYGEFYGRSRIKLSRMPTLYFSQSKNTDMEMRIYDKAKELMENSPQKKERYEEWLGWKNTDKIYRVEVVLHNTNVREFCSRYQSEVMPECAHEDFLYMIGMPQFLGALFCDSTDRMVYFRDRYTHKKVSIVDMAGI